MSWEIKKLNECCISIADGDHLPPPKSETGVPFVTIANVDSYNHFDFTDTMFVPQSYYDKLDDKRKARKGDILWTAPCQVDRRKNKIVFSRISGMGSWNSFYAASSKLR